jgi:hypothetical protein
MNKQEELELLKLKATQLQLQKEAELEEDEDEIIEESHPDVDFLKRTGLKTFVDNPEVIADNLKKEGFDSKVVDGDVLVKNPSEKEWRYLDAPSMELKDVSDLGWDLASGALQLGAAAGTGIPLLKMGPKAAIRGGLAAESLTGAGLEHIRQNIGEEKYGDPYSQLNVALSGLLPSVSHGVFGSSLPEKKLLEKSKDLGLNELAVAKGAQGLLGRFWRSLTKSKWKKNARLLGIPEDIAEEVIKDPKTLKMLQNADEYSPEMLAETKKRLFIDVPKEALSNIEKEIAAYTLEKDLADEAAKRVKLRKSQKNVLTLESGLLGELTRKLRDQGLAKETAEETANNLLKNAQEWADYRKLMKAGKAGDKKERGYIKQVAKAAKNAYLDFSSQLDDYSKLSPDLKEKYKTRIEQLKNLRDEALVFLKGNEEALETPSTFDVSNLKKSLLDEAQRLRKVNTKDTISQAKAIEDIVNSQIPKNGKIELRYGILNFKEKLKQSLGNKDLGLNKGLLRIVGDETEKALQNQYPELVLEGGLLKRYGRVKDIKNQLADMYETRAPVESLSGILHSNEAKKELSQAMQGDIDYLSAEALGLTGPNKFNYADQLRTAEQHHYLGKPTRGASMVSPVNKEIDQPMYVNPVYKESVFGGLIRKIPFGLTDLSRQGYRNYYGEDQYKFITPWLEKGIKRSTPIILNRPEGEE